MILSLHDSFRYQSWWLAGFQSIYFGHYPLKMNVMQVYAGQCACIERIAAYLEMGISTEVVGALRRVAGKKARKRVSELEGRWVLGRSEE